MKIRTGKRSILLVIIFLMVTLTSSVFAQERKYEYYNRFMEMYQKIHAKHSGEGGQVLSYFSPEGAPYHSVETMVIEAPDHGHETTSEAYSFWIWLEAMYARLTGDFSQLNAAWKTMEEQIIPLGQQPGSHKYNPADPADYLQENLTPEKYPVLIQPSVPVGNDPISRDLADTYGTWEIYGMHWLLDCDNFYGYGNWGDGVSKPAYINTFQRGPQESTWETVPHPSHEMFKWGSKNGFLPLFIDDPNGYKRQWRYTNAPDADARVVQAMYWAYQFAKELGISQPEEALPIAETKKMGDYLRLSFFDKYFKTIGCQDENDAGQDYDSAHYLLGWYYAWGGSANPAEPWAWRIGSSSAHFGYQNPLAAYALSQLEHFKPASPRASADWSVSFQRQLEFYRWLQSAEGAIAGGGTNNLMQENQNGQDFNYSPYPAGASTFYGLIYDPKPVYHDPPSNRWFGMQAWSMERMCELYYLIDNPLIEEIVEKWINWVKSEVRITTDSYEIPNNLIWSGQPDSWNPAQPGANQGLHVQVENYCQDPGVTAALAKALIYYAAGTRRRNSFDPASKQLAKDLLDRMYANKDELGVGIWEERGDYKDRFLDQNVHVTPGFSGKMANGDLIEPGVKFFDLRTNYKNDSNYNYVIDSIKNGVNPRFKFHRFWHQADVALAFAEYARFFDGIPEVNLKPTVEITSPLDKSRVLSGEDVLIEIKTQDYDGTIDQVELFIKNDPPIILPKSSGNIYQYSLENVQDGYYAIKVVVTDNQGAQNKDQVQFVVESIVTGPIKIQYKVRNTDINTQQIAAALNIVNSTEQAINLKDYTIRYFYTREALAAQRFNCFYAQIGSNNVHARFKPEDSEKYYLELYFDPVILAAGSESGQVQIDINNEGNAEYNQSDDWSFSSTQTAFADWYKVCLYNKEGNLIWGLEDHEWSEEFKISLTAPVNGSSALTGSIVPVSAEVYTPDSSFTPEVVFYQDGVEIGKDSTYPYTIDSNPLVTGSNEFYAVSQSASGNFVQTSTVLVNASAPFIDVNLSIPSLAAIQPGDDVQAIAEVNTNVPGTVTVQFFVNDSLVKETNSSPYTHTIKNISEGNYKVDAIATVASYSANAQDILFEVVYTPYLTIDFIRPQNGDSFNPGDLVQTEINVDSNQVVDYVDYFFDSQFVFRADTAPYDYQFTIEKDGPLTAKAVAGTLTASQTVQLKVIQNSDLAIQYAMKSWENGFTVEITIINNSSVDINPWELTFDLPEGQKITSMWNADYTQTNQSVAISTSLQWNKTIAKNTTRKICGFNGTLASNTGKPVAFYLNGERLDIVE